MNAILKLLQFYNFDLGDRLLAEISQAWSNYDLSWLRSAITESMYRGRYKVISIEQIMESWQRKQEIFCKFDREFETLVWKNFSPDQSEHHQTKILNNSVFSSNFPTNSANSVAMIKKLKSLCQA
jgi:hypothetical protein